jgi:hypothetical protein
MVEYTLSAIRCEVIRGYNPGDGDLENLIEIEVAILRDGEEIDRFIQRYGIQVDTVDLRENLLTRIKESISVDYAGLQQANDEARCTAIAANIEAWSLKLP